MSQGRLKLCQLCIGLLPEKDGIPIQLLQASLWTKTSLWLPLNVLKELEIPGGNQKLRTGGQRESVYSLPTAGEKAQTLRMLMAGQDGEFEESAPTPHLFFSYQKNAVSTGQPPLGYDTGRDRVCEHEGRIGTPP